MDGPDERAETGPAPRVREAYEDWVGASPDAVAVAPGRVNLVGGHVDYNGGVVLPAPIDRTTAVAVGARPDSQLRVRSLAFDETVTAPLASVPDGWAAYVFGAVAALAEPDRDTEDGERPGAGVAPSGLEVVVASDVPLGAGLSSSAALCVATVGVADALWTRRAADTPGGRRRLSCESVAEIAWRAETEFVGTDCGIMDQLTSACGQAGHALRIDCRDRTVSSVPMPDDAALLVADTTVAHELRDGDYDERVAECREAVARLDEALDRPVESLRDVSPDEVAAHADRLGDPYAARARHVTTESDRVDEAVSALEAADLTRLGGVMTEAHRSLATDYAVSCAEVEAVVAGLTATDGVYGARMVGGGWGGSVVALTDPDATETAGRAARERCERETGVTPDVYETRVGDGLRVER